MELNDVPSQASARSLWSRRQWLGTSLLGLAGASCRHHRGDSEIGSAGSISMLVRKEYFAGHGVFEHSFDGTSVTTDESPVERVISEFEEKTSIRVDVIDFETNEDLHQKLTAGKVHYDLAMPSGFMAKRLLDEGWLARIPPKSLKNLSQVDSRRFGLHFDRAHAFTVPYLWGSLGIAYNVDRVERIPKTWAALFAGSATEKGLNIALFDEDRFALGAALIHHGFSPNTCDVEQIEKAGNFLLTNCDRISSFQNANLRAMLQRGEIDMALARSGDVARSMQRNHRVRLALPEDGTIIFKEAFVLPRSMDEQKAGEKAPAGLTRKREHALALIDHLLQPKIAAQVSDFSCYATTVPAARAFVNRFIAHGPAYFINPAGRDHALQHVGEHQADYRRVWDRVKREWGSPRVNAL